MSETATLPTPGQIARVRQRTYLVEQVVKPKRAADSTLVRLSCVDDDNQGQPLEVLWEKELDPAILTGEAWESVAKDGFDDSRLFAAYFNTLKWNCVTSPIPGSFSRRFVRGFGWTHISSNRSAKLFACHGSICSLRMMSVLERPSRLG